MSQALVQKSVMSLATGACGEALLLQTVWVWKSNT